MANEIRIRAVLDDKISSNLDRIHDKFDTVGKSKGFQSVIQGAGIGAGISLYGALGRAIGGATDFVVDSIAAASDLNETMSKSSVVFGNAAGDIDKWGDTTAKSLGLSKQAATEAAATFGNLFIGLNLGQEKAADMSKALVNLAGDLASFNNIDPEEALQRLRSGLAGEAEPLRRVGVFLSEARVKAKAAALGFQAVHGEFTEGQKVIARYNLILDDTKTAQGDFARTSGGMANQQRILNAELENTSAEFGEKLIPVVIQSQHAFIDFFEVIDGNADALPRLGGDILALISGPFVAFEKAMYGLGYSVGEWLDGTKVATTGVGKAMDDVVPGVGKAADDIVATTNDKLIDSALDWRDKFHDASGDVIQDGRKVASALAHNAQDAIDNFFDPIEARNDLWDTRMQLLADREALRKAKGTADSRRAKNEIVKDLDDQAGALVKLGEQGGLTAADVAQFERDVKANFGSMSTSAQAKTQAVINKLRALAGVSPINIDVNVAVNGTKGSLRDTHGKGHGYLEFAEGGVVPGPKGKPQLAVVHGGEYVVSNEEQDQMFSGGAPSGGGPMGGLTVNFNSIWPPTEAQAREIAKTVNAQLAYLR